MANKKKTNLWDFLTLNPYGALLFSLIGLIVFYLILVLGNDMTNPWALIGVGLVFIIILYRNLNRKDNDEFPHS